MDSEISIDTDVIADVAYVDAADTALGARIDSEAMLLDAETLSLIHISEPTRPY